MCTGEPAGTSLLLRRFVPLCPGLASAVIVLCSVISYFFFSSRRRHTRLVSDWSSDVCSSDLFFTLDIEAKLEPDVARAFERVGEMDQRVKLRQRAWTWRTLEIGGVAVVVLRSEERRVGKEGRSGGWQYR